jgi:hypothetical protein
MTRRIADLPVADVEVDASDSLGPLEVRRHGLGYGGIDPAPLPAPIVEAVRSLRPRWIRVFIQEFFHVYRGNGQFDWTLLDPFMDALETTGAKLVAAICIKPPALFPQVDQRIWRPNDIAAWQEVISALVRRYSVERPLVTHWEIGNEVDFGEGGGCPYLIRDPADYVAYYRMTSEPILEVFPDAKIGGPANARAFSEPLPGLVGAWRRGEVRLDFLSYHLYGDEPNRHGDQVRAARALLADGPAEKPEILITEFSPWFEETSTEDQAFEPRRAGCVGAAVIEMINAGAGGSFHYHIRDQVMVPERFETFFSADGIRHMVRHFNEVPHRFALFGLSNEARPTWFVYWMLSELGDERIRARFSDRTGLRALAARRADQTSVMLVNHGDIPGSDRIARTRFTGLSPGPKNLEWWRIDSARRWSDHPPRLAPLERRPVWTYADYETQILLPEGSAAMVRLETRE